MFQLLKDLFDIFQTLSSWATCSVEEVASTGPGIRFFQLYVSFRRSICVLSIWLSNRGINSLGFRFIRTEMWLDSL